MVLKVGLTNERLKKKYKNNFELANFAISFTKERMQSGEVFNLTKILAELTKQAEEQQ